MNQERALELIRECVDVSCDFWGIKDVLIEIGLVEHFEEDEAGMGKCVYEAEYNRAGLLFCLNNIDDEQQLWESCAHECVHIALRNFDIYYQSQNFTVARKKLFEICNERTTVALTDVFLNNHSLPKRFGSETA